MERSKEYKHVVCIKDNDVDNVVNIVDDDSDEFGNDDGVNDGVDGANMHLISLSQAADCCLTERSKQNKHVVCNEDNNVDDDSDYSVDNGDDGVDDCDDNGDKYLTHLSQ
eukprot:7206150-Ditylum_brightwellii.AAC.1